MLRMGLLSGRAFKAVARGNSSMIFFAASSAVQTLRSLGALKPSDPIKVSLPEAHAAT